MPKALVDLDTGEVYRVFDEGIEPESDNRYENYVFVNEGIRDLIPELTANEKAVLMSVLPFVQYKTNRVAYPNGRPIKVNSLSKLTGLSKNTLGAVLKSLEEKNLLLRAREGKAYELYVNPDIFCKGRKIFTKVKEVFDVGKSE